jgi:hypothetical protein
MFDEPTLVMIATVAPRDVVGLAVALNGAEFAIREVKGAHHADGEIDGFHGASVLVIDAGLLQMLHDPQWRDLRRRRPHLGVVVRSLIPRDPGFEYSEAGSLLVYPDNHEALLFAVRSLARCESVAPQRSV